ncbi:hypothetical protein N8I77_010848 [Diaporthe amygdali]|uniref:Uncharacterized protein n=1 Tax=Phomopsis amygdali TaxID=1214568 RepID=A0AAD9SAS7_PHOAM|nr:hypothetical protein N8I77_010848 [Diaporthe amygdali]
MKLSGLLVLIASAEASAKAVFAHFMVGNVPTWSAKQWESDIALAQSAHIDAFALNIAASEPSTSASLDLAFGAAASVGFKLFFSFDYAGNGPFDKSDVISYINKYAASPAYYRHNGKPFVSTFEGPLNAADWVAIKSATDCFFVPDWSSEGAKAALALVPGVPDGLFSWAAWPWGDRDSNTYTDASYLQYLNDTGKALPYMMPVSPWFYTNLPGYNKNWLWRGDDLWYDRWEEAIWVQPEFIEIISWNDYGESHYIGPLHDDGFDAFSVGKGPFNFAKDMPHDGWRQLLPFVIDTYKNGIATVTEEAITAWYRLTPKTAGCQDGDTTGNTASQLQVEFTPSAVVQDKIFYSALLASAQAVTVTVGGADLGSTWTHTPSDPVGIYHGSVAYGSHTGTVEIKVGDLLFKGESITTSCTRATGQNGLTNWNAWVGSQTGGAIHATPSLNVSEQVCVEGTGATGFSELSDLPIEKNTPGFGTVGYPAVGKSADYSGLCEYACNYGYCPEQYCSTTNSTLFIPTSSPFDPPACISGTGSDDLEGLCSYACNFGYCPIHSVSHSLGSLSLHADCHL